MHTKYKMLRHCEKMKSQFQLCYLTFFLTDIKGFVRFVTNQHCVNQICGMFIQVFRDRCSTYSSN